MNLPKSTLFTLLMAIVWSLSACNLSDDPGGSGGEDSGGLDMSEADSGGGMDAGNNGVVDMGDMMADMTPAECSASDPCEQPEAVLNKKAECINGACVESCLDDFQDNDGDGLCTEACSHSDIACAESATCDDSSGTAECVCPLGLHADENTGECVLDEQPKNGSFIDMSEWQLEGDATIETGDDGEGDPGYVEINNSTTCAGARWTQNIELGPYEDVGPVVVRLRMVRECFDPFFCEAPLPALMIGDTFQSLKLDSGDNSGLVETSVCVPPSEYGGDIELQVVPERAPYDCSMAPANDDYYTRVSRVWLEKAADGACPEATTFANGDFEADAGVPTGWETAMDSQSVDVSIATDGSGDQKLALGGTICGASWARQKIGFDATSFPGAALEFEMKADPAQYLTVQTDGLSYDTRLRRTFDGTGNADLHRFCLPTHLAGTVQSMRFTQRQYGGGSCSDAIPFMYLDDIKIVDDPDCANPGSIPGGDFETEAYQSYWKLDADDDASNLEAIADYQTSSGNTVMRLRAETWCANPSGITTTRLPSDLGTGGGAPNAIRFRYRTDNIDLTEPEFIVGSFQNATPLTPAELFTARDVCLGPEYRGYAIPIRATVGIGGGCQGPFDMPETLYVDDVELVNSSACMP